jgi:formate hydrogenlyase subunit 3/multisubunit Na+/H+ antiporter MnhD subunit
MNRLLLIIFLPIIMALFCFIFKRAAARLALITSAVVLALGGLTFYLGGDSQLLALRALPFGAGVFLAAAFFTFLIILYSLKFMAEHEQLGAYYGNILLSLGASAGVLFATDYLTLLLFWGILGVTLYLLIGVGGERAAGAARKTLIIVGGSDALMFFGLGLIFAMTGTVGIGVIRIPVNGIFPALAFLSLAAGALAKAGAVPFHTWIPDSAEVAPVPVMAYMPAALDKLLGIYLLARLSLDVFVIEPNSSVSLLLMFIGSLTIVTAVMAALFQHNLKKLLSFHAVSQVGYMVLGIGTGIPVAMAGGIFHMFNHAIYKSLLFLCGGAVEKQTGTTELDRLGGLAGFMPITFGTMLIAALAISGVPPLNGFFSKWMIYQGVIELQKTSPYWIVWLMAAMFGSALTLASFIKVIHTTFLGQWSGLTAKAKEVEWTMWLPLVVLATLCVVFGVFAYSLPLPYLVAAAVPAIRYSGFFNPVLATALILLGLLIGSLIYYFMARTGTTAKPVYIGGELLDESAVKVAGTEFYDTIKGSGPIPLVYAAAANSSFDLYELGDRLARAASAGLRFLHNGLLSTYLFWLLFGAAGLLFYLVR